MEVIGRGKAGGKSWKEGRQWASLYFRNTKNTNFRFFFVGKLYDILYLYLIWEMGVRKYIVHIFFFGCLFLDKFMKNSSKIFRGQNVHRYIINDNN